MKKYKFAIVRPDGNVIPKGFYNSQELGLAAQLSRLNVDVDVYYAGNVDKVTTTAKESAGAGIVNLIELPFYNIPFIQQAQFPALISELKKHSYDAIQVNEYNDLICKQAVNYAYKHNIAAIVYQGMYKNLSGRFNRLYTHFHNTFLLKSFINKVSFTLTKTAAAAEFLSLKGFVKPTVMPVGLDLNAFNEHTDKLTQPPCIRQEYNIPADHKIVIYVGSFERRRNINFLLDIAARYKDKPVSFIYIGEGELFEQAKARVTSQKLSHIVLPGRLPQKNLPPIYQAADLFLLASDYEIYGMVVLEAMFYGVPVISNDTAGPTSIIDSNKNGYILNNFEVSNWVNTLDSVFDDETKLVGLKEQAKTKIAQELTWERIAHRYVDEIFNVLSKA